jgi:hypothetical protein
VDKVIDETYLSADVSFHLLQEKAFDVDTVTAFVASKKDNTEVPFPIFGVPSIAGPSTSVTKTSTAVSAAPTTDNTAFQKVLADLETHAFLSIYAVTDGEAEVEAAAAENLKRIKSLLPAPIPDSTSITPKVTPPKNFKTLVRTSFYLSFCCLLLYGSLFLYS